MNTILSRSILAITLASAAVALAGTPKQPPLSEPAKPLASSTPSSSEMMMPLIAPFFVQNEEFSSFITIVSYFKDPTTVQVILHDQSGAEAVKQTVSLDAHSQKVVQIADLLRAGNSTASIGSVELIAAPDAAKLMAVVGQVSITDVTESPAIHMEEPFLMPAATDSNAYGASLPSGLGEPVLSLMSTSARPQSITTTCVSEKNGTRQKVLQLAPGETALTEPCAAGDERLSIADFDHWAASSRKELRGQGAVGLSVTTSGGAGDLGVYGLAVNGEKERAAFTGINFFNTGQMHSSDTVFTGVPVGLPALLPEGPFIPEIALANVSAQPVTAKVLYAANIGNAPSGEVVATIALPPQSSKTVRLSELRGDEQMQDSLVVQSSAKPGSLFASLVATGGTAFQAVQLGRDPQSSLNGGMHPWSIADGTTSILLLFNPSKEKQTFYVFIGASGTTTWHRAYDLAPLETKSVNINQLIAGGVKDPSGDVLPKTAKQGEANWFTLNPGEGTGRMLVSNPNSALARSFSCAVPLGICGFKAEPPGLTVNVGQSQSFAVSIEACGTDTFCPYNGAASEYNTSVISASGDKVTGLSPGFTGITWEFTCLQCAADPEATASVTVNAPCVFPTGDTTYLAQWGDNTPGAGPSQALFDQQLTPTNISYAGGLVTEFNASAATDDCWYNGAVTGTGAPATPVSGVSGGSWSTDASGHWGPDDVGLGFTLFSQYQSHLPLAGKTSCNITMFQNLAYRCSSGSTALYEGPNVLSIIITGGGISVSRAGTTLSKQLVGH